jgi:ribosomal protein S18 acetylase RimI-like enzyme
MVENGKRKILGVSRLSVEPDGKHGEMAFIVSDYWQGLGLGTKLVDYSLDLAKEKGIKSVYAIMLQDNYRAISLTKKMGFSIEYLSDGTVKGTLDLAGEDADFRCAPKRAPEAVVEEKKPAVKVAPVAEDLPIVETKPIVREGRESSSA